MRVYDYGRNLHPCGDACSVRLKTQARDLQLAGGSTYTSGVYALYYFLPHGKYEAILDYFFRNGLICDKVSLLYVLQHLLIKMVRKKGR